jgi:hypothetical protein
LHFSNNIVNRNPDLYFIFPNKKHKIDNFNLLLINAGIIKEEFNAFLIVGILQQYNGFKGNISKIKM